MSGSTGTAVIVAAILKCPVTDARMSSRISTTRPPQLTHMEAASDSTRMQAVRGKCWSFFLEVEPTIISAPMDSMIRLRPLGTVHADEELLFSTHLGFKLAEDSF